MLIRRNERSFIVMYATIELQNIAIAANSILDPLIEIHAIVLWTLLDSDILEVGNGSMMT